MKNSFLIRCYRRSVDYVKYFCIGFVSIAVIHYSGSCSKSSNPLSSTPPSVTVDVTKIHDAAKSAEDAFVTGDPLKIASTLTEDSKALYADDLGKIGKDALVAIGSAMKTRKLDIYGDQYAEFSFQKDGSTFTVAFARQDDGSWKLMRF